MRFSIEWLDRAPNAAPEEQATACDLQIWVNDVNVTEHLEEGSPAAIDHVSVAAYHLAEGVAHDWWTIFGARDYFYRLTRHRMGYALPDICLQYDGRDIEITIPQRPYRNPVVRFWAAPRVIVPRNAAEEALATLVTTTIERLESADLADTGLQLRWQRVQQSRLDPDEQLFCECAGALGRDPYDLDEGSSALIENAATLFDGEPLIEFLAGLRRVNDRQRTLAWIGQVEASWRTEAYLPDLADVANHVAADVVARSGERVYEMGYRRARVLRRRLNMSSSERIASIETIARKFGSQHFVPAEGVRGLRAIVHQRAHRAGVSLARTTHESSMLFSLGRAIGQLVCFPDTERAPVNDLNDAFEQAAGRAFAAEFLAPIDEIRQLVDDGYAEDEIAAEFGVSDLLIERQLQNAERIDSALAIAA